MLYSLRAIVGPLRSVLIEAAAVLLRTVSTAPACLIVSSVAFGGFTRPHPRTRPAFDRAAERDMEYQLCTIRGGRLRILPELD